MGGFNGNFDIPWTMEVQPSFNGGFHGMGLNGIYAGFRPKIWDSYKKSLKTIIQHGDYDGKKIMFFL